MVTSCPDDCQQELVDVEKHWRNVPCYTRDLPGSQSSQSGILFLLNGLKPSIANGVLILYLKTFYLVVRTLMIQVLV